MIRKQLAKSVCLALLVVLTSLLGVCQVPATNTPRITDLFTSEESKRAGLSKLNPEELAALNAAIFRVMISMNSISDSDRVESPKSRTERGDLDFYDSHARAVAYIPEDDDENTLYLWDGKPAAYLDDDSLFGFNGKHLGWIKGGRIYDHDGSVVAALAEAFKGPVGVPPFKSFKQFKPFKAFKEFKPYKPFFSSSWSETAARVFFLQGAN